VQFKAAPGKGITVSTPDGNYSLNLYSRIVVQSSLLADKQLLGDISVRTTRLFLKGNFLSPETRYLMQFAFGPAEYEGTSPTPIFDAWVEHGFHRDLTVRIGQYFVPFDRARSVREAALQFVERAPLLAELGLDRDTGITAYSNDLLGLNGLLSYQLSLFGGDGKNRTVAVAPGPLYVGRIAVHPFGAFDTDAEGDPQRLSAPRLMMGLGAAYNQNTTRSRGPTGSVYKGGGVDYAHAAADMMLKWGGYSLMAEVIGRQGYPGNRTVTVDQNPLTEWTRSGWGYLIQGGAMLTDKLEATARWSQLLTLGQTDPDLEAQVRDRGKEASFGLNYYFNQHLAKIQAGYAYQFGSQPDQGRHVWRILTDTTF
jgi:hypothetical protein